jgi:pimeloyl-ACP methyl ester carboxylesterase
VRTAAIARSLLLTALVSSSGGAIAAAAPVALTVRGHLFSVEHVTAWTPSRHVAVLFLPGDGGWRGFAITIASRIAAAGYDVYAIDTRDYLEAFTGSQSLAVQDVAYDLANIASAIRRQCGASVELVGWSEGAALAIAAAARNPAAFSGVVAFGVPEQGTLGWRLRDSIVSLAGREPDEPQFDVAPLLGEITTTPFVMIQATHDPFTPVARAQALFGRAKGPKRLVFIEARNHRFDGGTERFFATLLDGLEWVQRGSSAPWMARGPAQ